jgi:hypothetical protein
MYNPDVAYWCAGAVAILVVPSPKFHSYVIVPALMEEEFVVSIDSSSQTSSTENDAMAGG